MTPDRYFDPDMEKELVQIGFVKGADAFYILRFQGTHCITAMPGDCRLCKDPVIVLRWQPSMDELRRGLRAIPKAVYRTRDLLTVVNELTVRGRAKSKEAA